MFRWVKTMFSGGSALGSEGGAMQSLITNSRKSRRSDPAAVIKKFQGWVYVCASRNASTAASVPLRLFAPATISSAAKDWYQAVSVGRATKAHIERQQKRSVGDIVELVDHPLLDLLRLANPTEIGFTLREVTTLHQELIGNAYWYLELFDDPVRAGQPKAIWPLLPNSVRIIPNKENTEVVGYLYGTDPRTSIAYSADEVIHFRYPNPTDSLYGLGPAQAGIMAINRKEAMDEYRASMYDNHCRPDFVVTVPEDTDPSEINRMYVEWDRRFKFRGGQQNKVGRPWFTTTDKSITPIGFPPNKMGDIPQAKLDRDEIYQMFGNPLTMGELSKSRAEAETGEYSYMRHAIQPRLIRMEQTLNELLVPMYDERLILAFDNPVPEDGEALLAKVEVGVTTNVMSRNEARQMLGLDERDDCEGFNFEVAGSASDVPQPSKGGTSPAKAATFQHRRYAARG